jgi:YfiH family protein
MTLSDQKKSSYLPIEFSAAPDNVRAYTTLISGGFSTGHYSEYNLATHVGDELTAVKENREKLVRDLALPAEPVWLDQVHSDHVVYVDENNISNTSGHTDLKADASVTRKKNVVCAVLTADCLPVVICNRSGTEVAVVHAGWRGLHSGIIHNTLNAMKSSTDELLVNLGPAIGPKVFEVGVEVMQAFVDKADLNAEAFVETDKKHYLCDIYQLARNELKAAGVEQVAGGGFCTYSEPERFYSYRRQKVTGRMASVIWLA